MGAQTATPDAAVAIVAARQHGVLTFRQLFEAGLSRRAIQRRVDAGRLHRLFRGVYCVGYPSFTSESRWMAAVLACGGRTAGETGRSFLSHRSAAVLWHLLSPRSSPIDVAVIGESGRERRPGLRIHRPRTLEIGMTTTRNSIPVTDPARTISDLRRAKPSRGGATPKELRRAMRQAAVLGLSLGSGARRERTRSDLEILFRQICRHHRLPAPEVNIKVGTLEVDFLWPDRRVIAETDGYRYHRGRVAFEDDHERDLQLAEMGFRVLRFSETQLENHPARVAAIVRRELAAG